MEDETCQRLRWDKWYLHGAKQNIDKCRCVRTPSLPACLKFRESLNMWYLKTPIGPNDFVNDGLNTKLVSLMKIRKAITEME